MSFTDGELFAGIPAKAVRTFPTAPASTVLPAAWQATADNKVTRHYTDTGAAEQAKVGTQRINSLRRSLVAASATIDKLLKGADEMDAVMAGAPSEELAVAEQALIDLQKRNDGLIKQCQMWKRQALAHSKRKEELEAALERAQDMAEQLQKQPQTPSFVAFIRKGTPGDSVRYLSSEVMKHAEGNLDLAGIAIALRMLAVDVDSLPQGTP
jgi:hypothetical protein